MERSGDRWPRQIQSILLNGISAVAERHDPSNRKGAVVVRRSSLRKIFKIM